MGICESTSRKDNHTFLEKGKNFLCEINSKVTGFFCNISINKSSLNVIMTNDISEIIENGKDLNVSYDNFQKTIKININELRFFCSDKNLNYTCIELLEDEKIDGITKINVEKIADLKENQEIVLYQNLKELNVINGKIKKIVNTKIQISNLNKICIGSPIIDRNDEKVIGIYDIEENGIYINHILNDIEKKREKFNLNYIKCIYDINESNKNKEIQILNYYDENKKEIENKCEIYINKKKIDFGYRYQFSQTGKNEVIISFKEPISNMKKLFYECIYLKEIDFTYFKSENVINMSELFSKCESIITFNLTNFNTQHVKDMNWMFFECKNIIDLKKLPFNTENVIDMSFMFQGCENLKNVDLSSFNTKNLIEMRSLFYDCINLKSVNLSSFNTKNVIDMSAAFSSCSSLTELDLSNFNTEKVVKINWMFYKCSKLIKLNIKHFRLNKGIEDYDEIFFGINENCEIECDDQQIKDIPKI